MLRKILESQLGPMSDAHFEEVMDLVTTDIIINRLGYKKRTSPRQVIEIAAGCYAALGRGKVA